MRGERKRSKGCGRVGKEGTWQGKRRMEGQNK